MRNIDASVTEQELRDMFGVHGRLNYCKLMRASDDSELTQHAFLQYENQVGSDKAVASFNGYDLNGLRL